MRRPSYKEMLFDERKDREEQLQWIKDAVNGSAKFYREPPYSYEEELAREIMQLHARIAELEGAQRWTPVSERLPEANEMSVSEHANYLLNEYGRLQFDYAAYYNPCGESLRNEARNNLEEYIAELEAERRWRVVADGELPEVYRDEDGDFIPFLVCEGDGDYPFTARYDGINWRAGIFVPDITHWMPLPQPPEVQE